MRSILLSVVAILACGGAGGVLGFMLAGALGLSGTPAAILAAVVGMAVATFLWALGATLLRKLGWLR